MIFSYLPSKCLLITCHYNYQLRRKVIENRNYGVLANAMIISDLTKQDDSYDHKTGHSQNRIVSKREVTKNSSFSSEIRYSQQRRIILKYFLVSLHVSGHYIYFIRKFKAVSNSKKTTNCAQKECKKMNFP